MPILFGKTVEEPITTGALQVRNTTTSRTVRCIPGSRVVSTAGPIVMTHHSRTFATAGPVFTSACGSIAIRIRTREYVMTVRLIASTIDYGAGLADRIFLAQLVILAVQIIDAGG